MPEFRTWWSGGTVEYDPFYGELCRARLTNGVHTLWISCKDANVNFGSASEVVAVAN